MPNVSVERQLLTYTLFGLPIGYLVTVLISAFFATAAPEPGAEVIFGMLMGAGLALVTLFIPVTWVGLLTLGLLPAVASAGVGYFLAPKISSRLGRAAANAFVGAGTASVWCVVIREIAGDESILGIFGAASSAWIPAVAAAVSALCCSFLVDDYASRLTPKCNVEQA